MRRDKEVKRERRQVVNLKLMEGFGILLFWKMGEMVGGKGRKEGRREGGKDRREGRSQGH